MSEATIQPEPASIPLATGGAAWHNDVSVLRGTIVMR